MLSFVLDGYQTEEVGKALNEEGIAVRSVHLAADPASLRPGGDSPALVVAFYHTCEEVDRMVTVVALTAQRRTPRH